MTPNECRDEAPRTLPSPLLPLFSFHLLLIYLLGLFLLSSFSSFSSVYSSSSHLMLSSFSFPFLSLIPSSSFSSPSSLPSNLSMLRLSSLFSLPLPSLLPPTPISPHLSPPLSFPLLHFIPPPLPLLNLHPLFLFLLSPPCLSLLLFLNGRNVFAESRRKRLLPAAMKVLIGLMVDSRGILSADGQLNWL